MLEMHATVVAAGELSAMDMHLFPHRYGEARKTQSIAATLAKTEALSVLQEVARVRDRAMKQPVSHKSL